MELADVTDSKSVGSDTVWVRVPPPAPNIPFAFFAGGIFTYYFFTLHFSRSLWTGFLEGKKKEGIEKKCGRRGHSADSQFSAAE